MIHAQYNNIGLSLFKCKKIFSRNFILFIAFVLNSFVANAQDMEINEGPSDNYFEEISITVYLDNTWKFDLNVIITEDETLFINIQDLFDKLLIACNLDIKENKITGFIENEKQTYTINFDEKKIKVGSKTFNTNNELINEMGTLYVDTALLYQAFGINLKFNLRSLSAKLETTIDLPVLKLMRLEKNREGITKLQGQEAEKADIIIPRNYHLFNYGTIDWGINSYQTKNEKVNNSYYAGVGTELLYGEANFSLNYNDAYKYDNRQLNYSWRWVDNDKTFIKQAQLGKIVNQSIAFLNGPLIGANINNSPTTIRKASGFYTLSDYTEADWNVELYINDILVDFTKADASGFYIFKVPLVYGLTKIKLKYYGPLGEERTEERTLNVPFNFTPAKTIEYGLTAGFLEVDKSKYSNAYLNYGVNRILTIGAGLEYLSSIPNKPYIPFATVGFQPFSNVVFNMNYAHDVSFKALLNYQPNNTIFIELDYAKYQKEQKATRFNALEERKIKISTPLKLFNTKGYARLNYFQYLYENFTFNQVDMVYSNQINNLNTNISTIMNWVSNQDPFITNSFAFSYRFLNGLNLRASSEYNYKELSFVRFKIEMEKRIKNMSLSTSYERNILFEDNLFFFNFKYDASFARLSSAASYAYKKLSFSESASGSIAFKENMLKINNSNNSSLSKGGIIFKPFLDKNLNGKYDKGEKLVKVTNVKISGGKANFNKKDSLVYISDLNAFVNYTVEFFDADLEEISWKFKHKTYQVMVDPNQYKKVDVPIKVMGEVSGMVYISNDTEIKGQGRISIQIIDENGTKVSETISESDGFYSYLGLNPGNYKVQIDANQLEKLNFTSTPLTHSFIIKTNDQGDIIEGKDFILGTDPFVKEIKDTELMLSKTDSNVKVSPNQQNITKLPEKENKIVKPVSKEVTSKLELEGLSNIESIEGLSYSVQIGAYKNTTIPYQLLNISPIFYEIIPNSIVRYLYGNFSTIEDALAARKMLKNKGYRDTFVVVYLNGKKIKVPQKKRIK
jgi:hypothetical protein